MAICNVMELQYFKMQRSKPNKNIQIKTTSFSIMVLVLVAGKRLPSSTTGRKRISLIGEDQKYSPTACQVQYHDK